MKEVGDTLRTYVENTNPTARIPAVSNTVADITADIAKGSISGAKYKQLASTIGEKLKTATGEELEAYRGIREALDDAMERKSTILPIWVCGKKPAMHTKTCW